MKTNPNELIYESVSVSPQSEVFQSSYGLTKREYFAAQIYAGMNAVQDGLKNRIDSATFAVKCADALIEALNKEKP